MTTHDKFEPLVTFLRRVPAVHPAIGAGVYEDGRWWVKLSINIDHALAWSVVQELAHVLNYLSLEERLPTLFMPVSPPPYMNGGPRDFLSWLIESRTPDFSANACTEWLEGRLPRPVDKLDTWSNG